MDMFIHIRYMLCVTNFSFRALTSNLQIKTHLIWFDWRNISVRTDLYIAISVILFGWTKFEEITVYSYDVEY